MAWPSLSWICHTGEVILQQLTAICDASNQRQGKTMVYPFGTFFRGVTALEAGHDFHEEKDDKSTLEFDFVGGMRYCVVRATI